MALESQNSIQRPILSGVMTIINPEIQQQSTKMMQTLLFMKGFTDGHIVVTGRDCQKKKCCDSKESNKKYLTSTGIKPLMVQMIKIGLQCKRPRFNPWVGKIPWRREWQPSPVFLPGKLHDRGAWWATVLGVSKSWTRLSKFHFTSSGVKSNGIVPTYYAVWESGNTHHCE